MDSLCPSIQPVVTSAAEGTLYEPHRTNSPEPTHALDVSNVTWTLPTEDPRTLLRLPGETSGIQFATQAPSESATMFDPANSLATLPTTVFAISKSVNNEGHIFIQLLTHVPASPPSTDAIRRSSVTASEDFAHTAMVWLFTAQNTGQLWRAINDGHEESRDGSNLDLTLRNLSWILGPNQARHPRMNWTDNESGMRKRAEFKVAFCSANPPDGSLQSLAHRRNVEISNHPHLGEVYLPSEPTTEEEVRLANELSSGQVELSTLAKRVRTGRRIFVNQAEV